MDRLAITPVASQDEKYFVTFLNDFTHFVFVCNFQNVSNLDVKFPDLDVTMMVSTSQKNMAKFCEEIGIQIQFTPPFTPELNGHAERINSTLTENCCSMLIESGASKESWGECIQTSVYLISLLSTSALYGVTAAELWYGNKLNISKLRPILTMSHKIFVSSNRRLF